MFSCGRIASDVNSKISSVACIDHHFPIGNSDFTDVGQHPVLFTALGPCVQCFDVVITNDNFAEGTETFSLILKQDPLLGSTGVVIEPNVAEITILDDSSDTCPGTYH